MSPVNFRQFYSYTQLTNYLRRITKEVPQLARLRSMGESREGRHLWVLEITNSATGTASEKPGYLVHANIHASEVAGTMSSLVLCHHLLSQFGSDEAVTRLLDNVAFYVIPRLNPDGAEYALRTGGAIRSRFEVRREANTLTPQDVNEDGLILSMRWQDESGNLKLDPDDPRRLVPRKPHDAGPFYRVATEGVIYDWDGGEFREATRTFDWNRNWGANWQPEHIQFGAGDFPFSEPEMRALAEFVCQHPNIFGMLGFHTGPQALLRPPASKSEDEFADSDVRVMKELGRKGVDLTGFPLYAVTDYHDVEDKPNRLRGHFTEWGYEHVGLFVFEIELGTLHTSAGISTKESFEAPEEARRDFEKRLLQWHDAHPDYGAFVDWQPFQHPQLGKVEIGGWKRYLWANPSLDDLPDISERSVKFIMEHASRFPQLDVRDVDITNVGGSIFRIRANVVNTGGFPTHITEQALKLKSTRPVTVALQLDNNLECLSRAVQHDIGHLAALSGKREVEWFVRITRGKQSKATIVVNAQKAGAVRKEVQVR